MVADKVFNLKGNNRKKEKRHTSPSDVMAVLFTPLISAEGRVGLRIQAFGFEYEA